MTCAHAQTLNEYLHTKKQIRKQMFSSRIIIWIIGYPFQLVQYIANYMFYSSFNYRGKCAVSLLNELENIQSYMEKEDTFFYTMVFDPNQKTLLVDKGEIRVGPTYQAEVPPYVPPTTRKEEPEHVSEQLWEPNKMADQKVEQFLVVSRSIGTFARALLDGAKKPQISLRLGAAAASRDITLVRNIH